MWLPSREWKDFKKDQDSRVSFEQVTQNNHDLYLQCYRRTIYLKINQTYDAELFECKYKDLKFIDGIYLLPPVDEE